MCIYIYIYVFVANYSGDPFRSASGAVFWHFPDCSLFRLCRGKNLSVAILNDVKMSRLVKRVSNKKRWSLRLLNAYLSFSESCQVPTGLTHFSVSWSSTSPGSPRQRSTQRCTRLDVPPTGSCQQTSGYPIQRVRMNRVLLIRIDWWHQRENRNTITHFHNR